MSLTAKKPVDMVSDQVCHKQASAATEAAASASVAAEACLFQAAALETTCGS